MNAISLRIVSALIIVTVFSGCAPQARQSAPGAQAVQVPDPAMGQQIPSTQSSGIQSQPSSVEPTPSPPQTVAGQQPPFVQYPGNQPPAAGVTPDPWPKVVKQGDTTFTLYQPQLDSWDGHLFEAHAAGSVLTAGAKDADFGAIEITANTQVDRLSRTVHFSNIQVTKVTFPSSPNKAAWYQDGFQKMVAEEFPPCPSTGCRRCSLSRTR